MATVKYIRSPKVSVTLMLTVPEVEAVEKAADRAGTSRHDYIRTAVLEAARKDVK